jgi:hypothetical protein
MSDLQRVFIGRNPAEAHHARGLLLQIGIEAEVRGEALHGARGEIPLHEAMPSVWVLEIDAKRARELLDGYFVEAPTASQGNAWVCSKCGERHEAQFTSCWSCRTERPNSDDREAT